MTKFFTDERQAHFIHLLTDGDISLEDARGIVRWMKQFEPAKPVDPRPLDTYLGVMTIEEKIMGAVQDVIDNFETTYDKKAYTFEHGGYWRESSGTYVFQSNTPERLPYYIR